MRKYLRTAYLAFIYLFLYTPIVILVVYSFNDSKFSTTGRASHCPGTPSSSPTPPSWRPS
jgi:ABC-type spermidine/putrescine transport system permease subunit II